MITVSFAGGDHVVTLPVTMITMVTFDVVQVVITVTMVVLRSP